MNFERIQQNPWTHSIHSQDAHLGLFTFHRVCPKPVLVPPESCLSVYVPWGVTFFFLLREFRKTWANRFLQRIFGICVPSTEDAGSHTLPNRQALNHAGPSQQHLRVGAESWASAIVTWRFDLGPWVRHCMASTCQQWTLPKIDPLLRVKRRCHPNCWTAWGPVRKSMQRQAGIGRDLMTWESQPKEFQDKSSSVRLQQGLARYKAKSGTWCWGAMRRLIEALGPGR